MIFPVNLGKATHHRPSRGCMYDWTPDGPVMFVSPPTGQLAAAREARTSLGKGGLSARLFVGLKVGQTVRWKPEDVADVVWRVRKDQDQNASATILMQLGLYESKGERVEEPSVQVIILDLDGTPQDRFVEQMASLAEALCRRLEQEEVILELQKSGVVQEVFSVTP